MATCEVNNSDAFFRMMADSDSGRIAERERCLAILRELAAAYGGPEGRVLQTAASRIEKE